MLELCKDYRGTMRLLFQASTLKLKSQHVGCKFGR